MPKANPQKEKGYTAIANEIVEQLEQINLSPYETRILLAVLRKTYGWNKKVDMVSLTQFEKATKLKRRDVTRSLKRLEDRRIIKVFREGKRSTNWYEFNKNYTEWEAGDKPVDKLGGGRGSRAPTHRGYGDPTGVGAVQPHTKETLKDNLTKDSENSLSTYPHDDGQPANAIVEGRKKLITKFTL